jgi:adenosylmethionine-8-amino-7-oxononanoate aminotransferase
MSSITTKYYRQHDQRRRADQIYAKTHVRGKKCTMMKLDKIRSAWTQDKIATGFGRTGKMFAVKHAKDVAPGIMCIGNALLGGFLSFAVTLTSQCIAEVFSQGPAGVLMHGPTFMGNPLACAVSLASLNLLQSYDLPDRIGKIERQLQTELEPLRDSPLVHDVRVLGAIGVVEMKEPMDMKVVQPQLVDHGVWLRPFGKLLYTMPPFVIQPHELRKITKAMVSLATRRRI